MVDVHSQPCIPQIRLLAFALGASVAAGAFSGCSLTKTSAGNQAVDQLDSSAMNRPLPPDGWDVTLLSTAIFRETNRVRQALKLKKFEPHRLLDRAADLQATSNALNQTAAHINIVPVWATPADRVREVGLKPSIVSENAASLPLVDINPEHGFFDRWEGDERVIIDQETHLIAAPHTYATFARKIVRAWMNSPGHRANIVNPEFRYLGCSARPTKSINGLDLITAIQVFFTPLSS